MVEIRYFSDLMNRGAGNPIEGFPQDYVGQLATGEYLIFMENLYLPHNAGECMNTDSLNTRTFLSFSRTRNNSRTQKTAGCPASQCLLRQARESSYRVYEEANHETSAEGASYKTYDFNGPEIAFRNRNRLITHAEFSMLEYQSRRRFRQTQYFAAPKSNLELLWRHSGLQAPLDFYSKIITNGRLISSTANSLYRSTLRNTFATHAVSGTADSTPYQNARMNAHLVHTSVFQNLITEHAEKWENHENSVESYHAGVTAFSTVKNAIDAATAKLITLETKITFQENVLSRDFVTEGTAAAVTSLMKHAWTHLYASPHAVATGTEEEYAEECRQAEVSTAFHELQQLVTAMNTASLSDSRPLATAEDWKAAQVFIDNHDDLCDAAGIHYHDGTKSRYNITQDFDEYTKTSLQCSDKMEAAEEQGHVIRDWVNKLFAVLKSDNYGFRNSTFDVGGT